MSDAELDLPALAEPELPAPGYRRAARQRRTAPRARTIDTRRLTRAELRAGAALYPPVDEPRPRTRGDCAGGERPCPWVACRFHLYLDVNPDTGTIKLNHPGLEPWELAQSCALDVADDQAGTLDVVGKILNLTRERVRQIEVRALLKIKMASPSSDEIGAALHHPPAQRRPRRRRALRLEEP